MITTIKKLLYNFSAETPSEISEKNQNIDSSIISLLAMCIWQKKIKHFFQ